MTEELIWWNDIKGRWGWSIARNVILILRHFVFFTHPTTFKSFHHIYPTITCNAYFWDLSENQSPCWPMQRSFLWPTIVRIQEKRHTVRTKWNLARKWDSQGSCWIPTKTQFPLFFHAFSLSSFSSFFALSGHNIQPQHRHIFFNSSHSTARILYLSYSLSNCHLTWNGTGKNN